ncbi:restriction endonuclease subunit S [Nitrospira sp. Nam80]
MRLEFDANEVCSNEYACYALNTASSVARLRALATGTTSVAAIYTRDLMGLLFVVPPKPEQRAIAAVLSDVDALIASLDQLVAKKRDLKQAAMQQLLTGQIRIPSFDGQWTGKRFGELAKPRQERIDPRRSPVQEFCIELEHIQPWTGELLGSTTAGENSSIKSVFREGDVLFGKLRAYLRKYWLADRPGLCSTEVWVFIPNEDLVTSSYLFQLIKMNRFIETASTAYGTHMPRSDWNLVKNYEIRLPPLPEQTAITAVLSDMDAEITALEARRDKTHALKQGMMQELLTGRVRLVKPEPSHQSC